MRYFRLATDCYLIEGDKDAAVYDVSRNRVFQLDQPSYQILRQCEDGVPVEEACSADNDATHLLNLLRDEGLGFFEHAPAFIDKFLPNAPVEWRGFCLQPPHFRRADWSITNQCDLSCHFCPRTGGEVSWQICQTCVRRDAADESERLFEDPGRVVEQIGDLRLAVLHLRGGNPLLEWERLQEIVKSAQRYPHLSIVVTTPGTGQPLDRILALYKHPNLRLNVVMTGFQPDMVRDVCGTDEPLGQQLRLIDYLRKERLPLYITFLISRSTQGCREAMLEFARERWQATPSTAEIQDGTDLPKDFRFAHVQQRGKPLAPWRSIEEFYFRIRFNTCLYGSFEISADGGIRPCAAIDQRCGEINGDGLRPALSGEMLYSLWRLGKSDVQPCDRCALRYACSDCTAAEMAGAVRSDVKEAYCPFEPGGDRRAAEFNWDHDGFVSVVKLKGKNVSCQIM